MNEIIPKKLLDICIPSFNRIKKLNRTLELLIPQVNFEVANIIIIDNHSDQPYLEEIDRNFSKLINNGIFLNRNISNIGLSGNLLKCFEYSVSDYLMMLADDDSICSNYFDKLLENLNDLDDRFICLKFSAKDNGEIGKISELVDYCQHVENFDNFIFTSNLVFRRTNAINFLETGFLNTHTYIPHFMMLLESLKHGYCIKLINETIVNYEVPSVGYNYALVAGLGVGAPKILFTDLSQAENKRFLKIFYHHNDFKVLVDLAMQTFHAPSNIDYIYFAKQYIFQLSFVRPKFKYFCILLLYHALKRKILIKLALKYLRFIPSPYDHHITEMLKRYRIKID